MNLSNKTLHIVAFIAGAAVVLGLLCICVQLWCQWTGDEVVRHKFYSSENNREASFSTEKAKLEKGLYMIAPAITWSRSGSRRGIGMKDLNVDVTVTSPQLPGWKAGGHEFWHIPVEIPASGEHLFNVSVSTPEDITGGCIVIKKAAFDYRILVPLGALLMFAGIIVSAIGFRLKKRAEQQTRE